MKFILFSLMLLTVLSGNAQEEMQQLLSQQNLSISDLKMIPWESSKAMALISESEGNGNTPISCLLVESPIQEKCLYSCNTEMMTRSMHFETYAVSITLVNGFKFHVADYPDGTRVVTCLNGSMQGQQGVAVNGIRTAESKKVAWYNGYYVHYYSSGKIISYPNKQIIEIY